MKVILTPVGSSGDVHPFVGLGLALRRRGHDVTVMTNGHFGPLVQNAGLEFVELGQAQQYYDALNNPDIWHASRGFGVVANMIMQLVRPMYDELAARYVPGQTVVVGASLALGARVAQEKLGLPLVTMHLQPSLFRSRFDPPRFADLIVPGYSPRWFRRFIFWLGDVAMVEPVIGRPLNAFRAELGLAPAKGIFKSWWNSPQRVLAMFPEWFAPRQPDWPEQVRLMGFPLYDEKGVSAVPAALEEFLREGDRPIVFTPGSAMRFGEQFFAAAAGACQKLGRRGLLLSRFREHIPSNLPAGVRHFDYAPLSLVLPRSAGMVCHGGIGTVSQALAAGVPLLIMPMSHDQPDNADRVQRLGVGSSLARKRFTPDALAAKLRGLIDSPEVAERCKAIAAKFAGVDALSLACEEVESVAVSAGVSLPAASSHAG